MNQIATAVRELRKHFRENQEAFAARVEISPRALASYESGDRKPTLPSMVQLMRTADAKSLSRLGAVFQHAIEKELGHAIVRFAPSRTVELVEGEEEDIQAVLTILRVNGKMYAELRKSLRELIEPAKVANRAKEFRMAAGLGLSQTIFKGLSAGLTDAEIVSQLPRDKQELARHLVENFRELARLSAKSAEEK